MDLPDPQPWRNPRPAPQLPELQPQLRKLLIPRWVRSWWPALVWACVIFTLSTDSFSSAHTYHIIRPLLHWLFPGMSQHALEFIHHLIRKTAHFSEYFIFYLFVFRGVRGARAGFRWTWGFAAWFVAAGYSCLDEIHQAFVAGRTASPYDSLLDSIGALFALLALAVWFYFRRPSKPAISESEPEAHAPAF
jgi:VanZ family protein